MQNLDHKIDGRRREAGAIKPIAKTFQIGIRNLGEHFVRLVSQVREKIADDLLVSAQRALRNFLAPLVLDPSVEPRARGDVANRPAGCLFENLAGDLTKV